MPPDPDIVVVATARTPLEAQLIAGILESEGIPVYVAGSLLQDEFAMSQAVLGLSATRIEVPRERLDDARRVLEEAHHLGELFSDGDDAECH